MDTSMNVYLDSYDMRVYDYIVVFSDVSKYYILIKANLHIGQQSVSLHRARKYSRKNEISIVKKALKHNKLYEKCLVIPYGREDRLLYDIDYYFSEIAPVNDNGKNEYGYYDEETQMIKAL